MRKTAPPRKTRVAACLFGFVNTRLKMLEVPKAYCMPNQHDRALAVLREKIGMDELTQLMAAGATMTEDEAIAQAQR